MVIKSITGIKSKLAGKKVLVRADFNVPLRAGEIKDDYKIIKGLATIKFLLKNNCRVIILTHLGEPTAGKINEKFSVKPIAKRLGELLGSNVKFISSCIGLQVGTAVSRLKYGEILVLENIRFEPGETTNSRQLAKELAKLADIYVNDAFAVSHRNHASVSAIKKFLPAYAGWLLEQEVVNLKKMQNPKRPLVVVLGGAKINTKISLIKKVGKKAKNILIGGALANNFFLAHGLEIGQSLYDKESLTFAKKFKGQSLILPVDVVVASSVDSKAKVKSVNQLDSQDAIYDIGPKTVSLFSSIIKQANTIFWNGPLGMFEEDKFKHGTLAIGRIIAARSRGQAFGVAGGGETVEALKMTKMMEYLDWVSTGGGAMLAFLGGEKMPGLAGIIK